MGTGLRPIHAEPSSAKSSKAANLESALTRENPALSYPRRRDPSHLSRPLPQDRLRIVLVGTRNPLNIGAAARAMSNFGFLRLRVVQPYEAAFRQARSAVGGAPVLAAAKEFPTVAEAVADCSFVVGTTAVRHRVPQQPLLTLVDATKKIHHHRGKGKVALLFGNEKFGLSNEDLAHCHILLHIPTREKHLSMNLGQAVAVCLYELSRDTARRGTSKTQAVRPLASPPNLKPATAADVERLTESLLEALRLSGYIKPQTESSVPLNIRRLLRRQKLTSPDAELWLGILRQILWKLRLI